MSFWLFIMAGCPATYDTRRTKIAFQNYHAAPSETTRRAVDEALALDKRDVLVYEGVMLMILGAAVFGFIRAGKRGKSGTN